MSPKFLVTNILLLIISLHANAKSRNIECESATFYETEDNQLLVRLQLNETLSDNFNYTELEIVDGPKVVSNVYLSQQEKPFEKGKLTKANGHNVYLKTKGRWQENHQYAIRHPEISSCYLATSVLPLSYPMLSEDKRLAVPHPYLPEREAWLDLYYAAWGFMQGKITRGKSALGFVDEYIDEGFNENIYQWDSAFMVAFAMYANPDFPAMVTLDNFYGKQDKEGYICRTYNENTGEPTGQKDINPPLFAWIEARYTRFSGDTSRISRVLPVLDHYFDWINKNVASIGTEGAVYNTDLGSGMDNSPRQEYIKQGAWIDLTAQQALAAQSIVYLAKMIGRQDLINKYKLEHQRISKLINSKMWHEKSGIYLDKDEYGEFHQRHTIASFWPMLAGVADKQKAKRLIEEHLKNPKSFKTKHLFPTLSVSDPVYDPYGHYWRGGVWAPTNFATIKGIAKFDADFAFQASVNHVENMSRVFQKFNPKSFVKKLPTIHQANIQRNGDGLKQIWESYSPEFEAPSTRWDAELLVRQKFVGWSGSGPIALLIENIIGLEIRGDLRLMRWQPRLDESQGLDNINFLAGKVGLRLNKTTKDWKLSVTTDNAFSLEIQLPGKKPQTFNIQAGDTQLTL